MEKTKRRKIWFNVVNLVLMVLILGGMFAISVPTGLAAVCFSIIGAIFASHSKTKRMQQQFFDKLLENREDLLSGKIITIYADDDAISVKITDPNEKKAKKEKKSAEKPAE